MNIIYTSDNEPVTLLPLETLIANFNMTGGFVLGYNETDLRQELASRGWYEGCHENGRYLVLVPDKLEVEPTAALHDRYKRLVEESPIKCRHRDDGRGRCIDCGNFI